MIGRQGRNNVQNVGAYETVLKWTITLFCNAKFKDDSQKIVNSSSKRQNFFFFFANAFPVSFGSYILHTWRQYSLVFVGYRGNVLCAKAGYMD